MEGAQKKSLTLISSQRDHDYSRIPSRVPKQGSGFSQLRNVKDSSEWKLNPEIFQMICKQWETPDVDLLASPI